MVVLLFVSTSYMPSEEEMSLAHENDVSILTGGLQQMRSAQFIADSSFLTGHKHHKKIFTEVRGDAPEGCEATVVIIRHCEKGSIREHCSYPGFERSVYLATLFGDDGERWPAPSQIFALSPGRHKKMNFREMELVSFYVSPFLYLLARPWMNFLTLASFLSICWFTGGTPEREVGRAGGFHVLDKKGQSSYQEAFDQPGRGRNVW
jgi:hypothetical protein